MRNSENTCFKVICEPCILTGVQFHAQAYVNLRRYTAAIRKPIPQHDIVYTVDRMTSLSPHVYVISVYIFWSDTGP